MALPLPLKVKKQRVCGQALVPNTMAFFCLSLSSLEVGLIVYFLNGTVRSQIFACHLICQFDELSKIKISENVSQK